MEGVCLVYGGGAHKDVKTKCNSVVMLLSNPAAESTDGSISIEMINSVAPSFPSQLVLKLDVTHSSV